MRTLVRLLAVVIFVLLSGCSDTTPPTGTGHATYWPDDPDAQWRATYIRGMFHLEGNVTLSFDSTGYRISGRSGCNEYYAELLHPSEDLTTVGRYMSTKMGCAGPLGDTENAFVDAIFKMHYLRVSADRLVIQDKAHQNLIIFRPATGWPGRQ